LVLDCTGYHHTVQLITAMHFSVGSLANCFN